MKINDTAEKSNRFNAKGIVHGRLAIVDPMASSFDGSQTNPEEKQISEQPNRTDHRVKRRIRLTLGFKSVESAATIRHRIDSDDTQATDEVRLQSQSVTG
jgi:hypothetical protein